MLRSNKLRLASALCYASLLLSCGGGDLIRNPLVNRWCGDNPCDWEVQGDIERVGSWHPNDYAVSLVSDDATLVQENATIDYSDSDCFRFAMVAKIDRVVRVFLELDFLADGSVEFSQRLPTSDWERRTFKVTAPDWYRKVRFIIRKDGPGRAILAEISAANADGECSAPPVELSDRPDGARCQSDAQCASSACHSGYCGGCVDDNHCADTEVCALTQLEHDLFRSCVGRGQSPLGAACDRDEQCMSGTCADGACSECKVDADCESLACRPAGSRPAFSPYWPRLCGGADRRRESGAACGSDLDCQSDACDGFSVSCDLDADCLGHADPCVCVPDLQLGTCR